MAPIAGRPAARLVGLWGPAWIWYAIAVAFLWVLLLGAWPSAHAAPGPVPAPAPRVLPL